MCGIVGYTGTAPVRDILLEGLRKLEYRGYDSAGIAVETNDKISIVRRVGKVEELSNAVEDWDVTSTCGIGHTRWATHGRPTEQNAHPHSDCSGKVAVVHNGIIENFVQLRGLLESEGHVFRSETDTEIVAHLIEKYYKGDLIEALARTTDDLQGAYGLAVMHVDHPGEIAVTRKDGPIVVGLSEGDEPAALVASDIVAIMDFTRDVVFLEDGQFALLRPTSIEYFSAPGHAVELETTHIDWDAENAERGGFPDFMLKEIFEQPRTITDCIRGRINVEGTNVVLSGILDNKERFLNARRIIFVACGTSWHAGLIGEYLFEDLCGIEVKVEYASEFRYRNPVIHSDDVVIAISQSGETADTLAAIELAKSKGAFVYGICNVVGSSIARATHSGTYIHVGPEIGVASTKAFTGQVTVLVMMAMMLAKMKGLIDEEKYREVLRGLITMPDNIKEVLDQHEHIQSVASIFTYARNFLYLGRGCNYPTAMEGALKLKEISYIHAEGCPAAEMKHGTIALIDQEMPTIVIATNGSVYEKTISNIQEIKARGGKVIVVVTEGDCIVAEMADYCIWIPKTAECLTPLLSSIPLQLFAYYIAVNKGRNVDQPRNLAKSVTVE